MKLLLILLFITLNSYAQSVNIYVPLRTYHFDRLKAKTFFIPTEGGDIGSILVLRTYKNNWFKDYQFGAIRNSFGKLSLIGQIGYGYKTKVASLSLNVGLMSGYKEYYRLSHSEKMPYVMRNLGIIPTFNISIIPEVKIRFNSFEIVPMITITPEFLNGGLFFRLK